MNAVNLIPADRRRRRVSISASRPTLALLGALVLVLIAAVAYVSAANTVTTRRAQLSQATAAAAKWTAAAGSYTPFVLEAQQRTQQLGDVRQLVAGRYAWSQLLSQIGGLMPATAGLTSLAATSTPGATASAAPQPAVQLQGCAASQPTVAQVMVNLRRVNGVTDVALSSSQDTGSGSSGSSGSGSCRFPVQFQISLTFAIPSATVGTTPAGSTPATPGTASTASAAPTSTTATAQ